MSAPARSVRLWFRTIAFLLLVVQGVVACAAISEGERGIGADAHVEAPTAAQHYAHADAGCPSCAGRLIHASTPVAASELLALRATRTEQILPVVESPSIGFRSLHGSRAPPPSSHTYTL